MQKPFRFFVLFLTVIIFSNNLFAQDFKRLYLDGNCITCHHETKAISAPSLKQIKKRYIMAFPEKEDFVNYMTTWVLNPQEETSIMLDMIEKYELMPQLGYSKETLEEISTYIYENNF